MRERTSRQDLVVPPKERSSALMVIGVLLCGCAGFAIVWISGMGRTVPVNHAPQPAPSSAASLNEPAVGTTAAPDPTEQADRYAVPSRFVEPETSQSLPVVPKRFPTQPASFEEPVESAAEPEKTAAEPDESVTEEPTPPAKLSRFSARQISPPSSEAEGSEKVDTQATSPESAAIPAAAPVQPKTAEESAEPKPVLAAPADDAPAVGTAADEPVTNKDQAKSSSSQPATIAAADTPEAVTPHAVTPDKDQIPPDPAASTPAAPQAAAEKSDSASPLAASALVVNPPSAPTQANPPRPTAANPPQEKPVPPQPAADQAVSPPSQPKGAVAAVSPLLPAEGTPKPANTGPSQRAEPADAVASITPEPAENLMAEERRPPPALPPAALDSNDIAAPLAARANPFAGPRSPAAVGSPKPPAKPILQPTAGAVPFAAAPPLAGKPAATEQPASDDRSAAGSGMPASSATGQGRPGVPQLEGLQTPQLTIEKSGPRDLQVGKPARFEVTIRNVGAATAHDTVLKDSIPYGTSLIATMPPASPAGPANPTGDLFWSIGELKPGQEARVAMELMPRLEGEIGSVASVSFRSDATSRSRVTKPALEITAEPPQKTLIGEAMTLELTLSNPGTGTATGVVVEGLLPEAVSHPAGREVEFDVGRLEPGTSRSITLVLTTVTPGVHEIRLAARADGGIEVAQRLRAEITAPMLELAADIPSRRYLQRPATCKLKMTNTGTAPAMAVELAAQLPTGMKFVRANNAGYYDERTHRVLWSLEELPAGEDGTVELVVMPTTLGSQAIVAAARNPAGLADQLTHTIEVEGLAALSFEVVDSEDPIEIGGLTEYVVRVTNQGTKAATNVELAANLLGDLEPVEAKGPVPFGIENLLVTFDPLATLAPADEAVFRIRVRGRRSGNQRVQFMLKSDDLKTPLTSEEMTHVYSDR